VAASLHPVFKIRKGFPQIGFPQIETL